MTSTASRARSDVASSQPGHFKELPRLIQFVFTAVNRQKTPLRSACGGMHGVAAQPPAMLALLVYHYAVGVLSSQDIESALWRDAPLRLLCNNEVPDWRQLRRFRRLNRDAVQRCLAEVLAASVEADASHLRSGLAPPALAPSDVEAERRICTAIMLDCECDDE